MIRLCEWIPNCLIKFNAYICKPLARECAFTAWLNFFKMAETPNLNWTFCLVDITIRSFYFYLSNRHFFPIDTPIMKILTTFLFVFWWCHFYHRSVLVYLWEGTHFWYRVKRMPSFIYYTKAGWIKWVEDGSRNDNVPLSGWNVKKCAGSVQCAECSWSCELSWAKPHPEKEKDCQKALLQILVLLY